MKFLNSSQKLFFLNLLFLCLFIACGKDDDTVIPTSPATSTIEEVIGSGGNLGFSEREETVSDPITENTFIDGEEWMCESYTVSLEDGIGSGPNGFSSFNPNANVIYPGNLLQGSTLSEATPSIIPVPRSGGTISIDIIDGNAVSGVPVDEVTKSEIQNAANKIIDNNKEVPANFILSAKEVHSTEQLAIEMGLSVKKFNSEFAADFSLNSSSNFRSFFVRLDQIFYTLSFDIPTSYDGFFAPEVTAEDLAKYVGPGNPATFISDVSYGRVYYMLVTCESTQLNIEAGVEGSFNGGLVGASGNVNVEYLKSLDNVDIKVKAYGGDAIETLRNFNNTNMDEIADMLAETTKIGTGLPISYVVRNVYDRDIVSVNSATTYDVVKCLPATLTTPPATTEHWDGVLALLGSPVGAAANIGAPFERKIAFFNMDGDQYVLSDQNQLSGPFPLDNLMNNGEVFPLATVGAGGRYMEAGSYRGTYFFDKSGLNFFQLKPDGSTNLGLNFQNWAAGQFPLADEGVGAFFEHFPGGSNVSDTRFFCVNRAGNKLVAYKTNTDNWLNINDTACWGVGGEGCFESDPSLVQKIPFNTIGAGTFYQISNVKNQVLINKEGTKYTLWDSNDKEFTYTFSF